MPGPTNPYVSRGPARPTGQILLIFLLVNVAVFLAYRVAFLLLYVNAVSAAEIARVLLYGLRLDLGLIGLESLIFGLVSVLALGIRLRLLVGVAAFLTALNAISVLVDLLFYAERNQHVGELLLTNITDLDHLGVEVASFVLTSPLAAAAAAIGLAAAVWGIVRLVRRTRRLSWPLHRPVRGFLVFFPAVLLLGLVALEPSHSKAERGYEVDLVNVRYYSRLNRLLLHEAIANPLQEILVVHLPVSFVDVPTPRLDPEEALAICRETLRLEGADPRYPLLREIEGREDLGLENVIVVQVEGLTGSVLDQEEGGEWVMPFLRGLSERGLFFPNTLHGYGNTAGGVFATVTGMPRTSLGEPHHRVFTRLEARTPYASLARCLDVADAWFIEGYRQSHAHYKEFAGNQGFTALTYPDLHDILAERGEVERGETVLGIRDGPLLEITMDKILAGGRPFVAHVITADTHYPWPVPEGFDSPVRDKRLRTFRHLDDGLRRLVGRLAEDPELHRKTLLVVLADHTNITFGEDPMERLRIPLVFHSPALERASTRGRRETLAGQTDVLPTCLALVAGRHPYAGIGRNLLEPDVPGGVIATARNGSRYFQGGFVFRRRLVPEVETLHVFWDGRFGRKDVSADHPEVFARLRRAYYAQYETARRLARERRVFPPR